jgi:hypothetical protein
MTSGASTKDNLNWRKSRRSATNGECVEVAPVNGQVMVRDSKAPNGPFLRYAAIDWQRFVERTRQADCRPLG